jgi:UDP-2,4-diacetamido-2,4,6-trideoxy-beta-L-altropyranose hydrolase
MITLRKAGLEDCERIYQWRNHPKVRKYFIDPREIDYRDHREWFEASLKRDDRILLMAYKNGKPVGVIRFDIVKEPHPDTFEIDIYVVPEIQGRGIGKEILRAGEDWLRENTSIRGLIAKVKEENVASVKMFIGCGFEHDYILFRKDI